MFQPPKLPPGGLTFQVGTALPFDGFAFCDGTVKKGNGAFAYVLLNAEGEESRTGWQVMDEPTCDSTTAEFAGLLSALKEAAYAGVRRLWVGTDSFQLIEHSLKRSERYARFIQALDQLAPRFEYLCVQAIERTRNKQADALARRGIAHLR